MSALRPNLIVTTSAGALSAAEAAVLRLNVSLGCSGAHDVAELIAWPSSRLADLALGDRITLALGELDAEQDVFTGEVVDVQSGPDALVIEALATTSALSRERKNQTYLSQSIAEIVRDLASTIDVADVQGDLTLDAYAVDDRRAVWEHLLDLADLAGADVACTASGALSFAPIKTGVAGLTLRHGADLLDFSFGPARAPSTLSVAPQGAASEQGAEKWHWIARTPTAQGSGPLRVHSALRTADAATSVSQVWAARSARAAVSGMLSIVGCPEPRPGDLIALSDVPADPGTLRVLEVQHRIDAREGFITRLRVEGAGGGL